jgi:hypothetical protein
MENTIRIIDVESNEVVDREMNEIELEIHEAITQDNDLRAAEQETRKQSRIELLERLGLTEDEAKLILG